MDIRQSDLWAKYLEELGWETEKLTSDISAYTRRIPFFGKTVKIPRAQLPLPLSQINKLLQGNDAFLVKLDPAIETNTPNLGSILNLLKKAGFAKDNWSLTPTKTVLLDLTKSEEELLKNMEKDTRYNVRLAEKNGVIVGEGHFEEFKNLYFATAKRKGFWPARAELEALWKIFNKERAVIILTAYFQSEVLASTLLLINKTDGHYYHAATSESHRKLMAPYLLLWQAIRFLKKRGVKTLDLEGIYDPRNPSTKKWKGFTLFKKGFGGREVEYIGSFVKYPKLWARLLFLPTKFF